MTLAVTKGSAMRVSQVIFAAAFVGFAAVTASASPLPDSDATELGTRGLGERCTHDCQCDSLECKGFKCVVRDYNEHPILPAGAACTFDGDCSSCDCAGGRCR